MVHRRARRRGVGRALMLALEDHARQLGRTTLILDTRQGDPSEDLYRAVGWTFAGAIPCLRPERHGRARRDRVLLQAPRSRAVSDHPRGRSPPPRRSRIRLVETRPLDSGRRVRPPARAP